MWIDALSLKRDFLCPSSNACDISKRNHLSPLVLSFLKARKMMLSCEEQETSMVKVCCGVRRKTGLNVKVLGTVVVMD
ncbi:hypothetical protein AV530_010463 [Patagioenas fasciata monilis]|uniref:Uncharacterized protein n=1 Tax=Patagioenas fasciata monilis TaxID=372326 RepID=A0A1V4KEY5_PATFA|nr:hypothetical protein AV530_010463 [Patagioenas fasciata monilis]